MTSEVQTPLMMLGTRESWAERLFGKSGRSPKTSSLPRKHQTSAQIPLLSDCYDKLCTDGHLVTLNVTLPPAQLEDNVKDNEKNVKMAISRINKELSKYH
eukprot:9901663-Karenia_brevis.AAC.1